jgi:hypothetical protein
VDFIADSFTSLESLKGLGTVAGIGGISLGVLCTVLTTLIRYGPFKKLGNKQIYQLLRLVVILTFATGICGLGAYIYADRPQRNDPPLPGDTGWIFAGYYWLEEKKWAEGPWVATIPPAQASAAMPIQIGNEVEVTKAELRYIIVDYKVSGLSNRLIPPTQIPGGVLRDVDDTGFRLNKGRRLIVRDISARAFPGHAHAYWLRVVSADHP